MTQPLYPHQEAGIKFLRKHKKVLFAWSMRVGKSRAALLGAQDNQQILIICPVVMKVTWQREVAKWMGKDVTVQILHKRTSFVEGKPRVLIIPYSIVNTILMAGEMPRPDHLILDESHYLKNWETKRTEASMFLLKKCKTAALLSGTPIVNRPADMWPTMLALRHFTNMHEFERKYCAAWAAPWGWDARGASNLDELAVKLKKFMMVIGRDQVQDMPDMFQPTVIEMDLPVDKREREFDRDSIVLNPSPVAFESMTDILKMSGERKAPLAVEHILSVLEGDTNKVIVWFWHRDVGRLIEEKLQEAGIQTAYVDGSVSKRQEEIDRFNTRENTHVILGQINAMGVGVEITGAHHNIFVEAPWSPAALWQAIARAWGPNQEYPHVTTDILTIHRSIDSFVLHTILKKQDIINTLVYKEKTMSKKTKLDWTPVDTGIRRLFEARSAECGETIKSYLKLMFPLALGQGPGEEEDAPEVAKTTKKKAAKKAKPDPVVEEISLDKVRHILSETIRACDSLAVKKVLADHQAQRLSDLNPGSYASVIDVCEELVRDAAEQEEE